MKDIEDILHRLPKVDPSASFLKNSRNRLLNKIELEANETWFRSFIRRLGMAMPAEAFLARARVRLMERISAAKPVITWLAWTKRLVASTLVMVLAVTATLFFVEGGQVVEASESTYVQVLSGTVTLKHADRLIWDEILDKTELSAGDLIKTGDGSEAVVNFFDDTQVRLAGNSLFLISQLGISPIYPRQGVIEVSLHEGEAWVQTLNFDDGYAGFTMVTGDTIVKAVNSAFNVETSFSEPTIVRVFQNKAEITTLNSETRTPVDTLKLSADEQVTVISQAAPVTRVNSLTDSDKAEEWAKTNLQKDQEHLTALRENELITLRQKSGTLPGELLYPIKQAKERLALVFTFDASSITNTRINIANQRLNEAILLLEQGDTEKANEALTAYQEIARQLAEEAKDQNTDVNAIASRLITPTQKALVASLPGDVPVAMVKEALNETKELLADNPMDLERIKLENSVETLRNIQLAISSGDIETAKQALAGYEFATPEAILAMMGDVTDDEIKKEILNSVLELQSEGADLVASISSQLEEAGAIDEQIASLLDNAKAKTEEDVDKTIAYIRPLMPEVFQAKVTDSRIRYFVEKIGIYETWQGQKNQINKLIKQEGLQANNIAFLTELRSRLDGRAGDYINTKILELQSKARYQQHKILKAKMDRAQREREERVD